MVINKYKSRDSGIYIGRGSAYGNPFIITDKRNRRQVVFDYMEWIFQKEQKWIRELARKELVGQNLICFCAPKLCHGDILDIIIKNSDDDMAHKECELFLMEHKD